MFFDQAIQAALGLEPSAFFKDLQRAMGSVICTQVVLLGSGMDTRPWRLRLPTGVSWFEVDRADVLHAKRKLLAREGAAFVADVPANGQSTIRYPLGCSEWTGVALDLQEQAWTEKLKCSGFKHHMPTIWVLEVRRIVRQLKYIVYHIPVLGSSHQEHGCRMIVSLYR